MSAVAIRPHRPAAPPAVRGPQPACEVIVGYTCVRPSHLAAALPRAFGYLVMHHGTCGYCPGQPDGRHEWAGTGGITLNELLRRVSRRPRGPTNAHNIEGGRP